MYNSNIFRIFASEIKKRHGNNMGILVSIYFGKCTYEELCKCGFLKTSGEYGISICLPQLEVKGIIKVNAKDEYVALASAKRELAKRRYFD